MTFQKLLEETGVKMEVVTFDAEYENFPNSDSDVIMQKENVIF